jgi:hypothetical protein
VYLVEDTVSGKMTATFPLPAEASGLSCDITEKVRSNCDADICGADTLGVALELEPGDELMLHAAAARAIVAAIDTQATFLVTCCKKTTCFMTGQNRPRLISAGLPVFGSGSRYS